MISKKMPMPRPTASPSMPVPSGRKVSDFGAAAAKHRAGTAPMKAPSAPASTAKSTKPSGSMMDRIKASGAARFKKGGMAKSGSSASKRADGIAHKGKTKGKMVKMNKGGYC